MDYSSSSDETVCDSTKVNDEPEVISETYESNEPIFTESVQEINTADNTPVDQTAIPTSETATIPTDQKPTIHGQPKGIEVPPSPETEPLDQRSTKDYGMKGNGPGRGLEGRG